MLPLSADRALFPHRLPVLYMEILQHAARHRLRGRACDGEEHGLGNDQLRFKAEHPRQGDAKNPRRLSGFAPLHQSGSGLDDAQSGQHLYAHPDRPARGQEHLRQLEEQPLVGRLRQRRGRADGEKGRHGDNHLHLPRQFKP